MTFVEEKETEVEVRHKVNRLEEIRKKIIESTTKEINELRKEICRRKKKRYL